MTPTDTPAAFDPATHTFGMAYRWNGDIVYPVSLKVSDTGMCTHFDFNGSGRLHVAKVVRAPEHDLIPVSALTAERALADQLAAHLKPFAFSCDEPCACHNCNAVKLLALYTKARNDGR